MRKTFNIVTCSDETGIQFNEIEYEFPDYLEHLGINPIIFELEIIDKFYNHVDYSNIDSDINDLVMDSLNNTFMFEEGLTVMSMGLDEVDTTERSYIVNKEEYGDFEFGIYDKGDEYQDFKMYDVQTFLKKNKILKKNYSKVLTEGNLLQARSASLNGNIGKYLDENTREFSSEPIMTGVVENSKKEFEKELHDYLINKMNEIKKDNPNIKNSDDMLDYLESKENKEIYKEEDFLIIKMSEELNLHIDVLGTEEEIFKGDLKFTDMFIHNEKENKYLRVRSSREPKGDILYQDHRVSAFIHHIKDSNELVQMLKQKTPSPTKNNSNKIKRR